MSPDNRGLTVVLTCSKHLPQDHKVYGPVSQELRTLGTHTGSDNAPSGIAYPTGLSGECYSGQNLRIRKNKQTTLTWLKKSYILRFRKEKTALNYEEKLTNSKNVKKNGITLKMIFYFNGRDSFRWNCHVDE